MACKQMNEIRTLTFYNKGYHERVGYNRDGFGGDVSIFEALSPTFFFLSSVFDVHNHCIAFSFYYTGLVVYQCGLLNVSVLKQEVISTHTHYLTQLVVGLYQWSLYTPPTPNCKASNFVYHPEWSSFADSLILRSGSQFNFEIRLSV